MDISKFVAIKGYAGSFVKITRTKIKCDAGDGSPKAYTYLVSTHGNSGDRTMFEFGVIRIGYSGGYVTKYAISQHGNIEFNFINDEGFVAVENTNNALYFSIFG